MLATPGLAPAPATVLHVPALHEQTLSCKLEGDAGTAWHVRWACSGHSLRPSLSFAFLCLAPLSLSLSFFLSLSPGGAARFGVTSRGLSDARPSATFSGPT